MSAFKGQNDHGENIVQRHRADDHKRCHAGVAVNILDKGNAENGGAAAVRTLHEGTDRMLVLQSKLRNDPHRQDRKKSGNKAESDIFHIKMMPDICACQIQKNKTWQADLEDKTVCGRSKMIIDNPDAFKNIAKYHNGKDWYSCVYTENKTIHGNLRSE